MKLPSRAALLANGVALAVLLFFYAGDLLDTRRAMQSELAAMVRLPHPLFASAILALAGALLVAMLVATILDKADPRLFRLLPIAAVVALFIDLFVLSKDSPPFSSADTAAIALSAFAQDVQTHSPAGHLLDDQAQLDSLAKRLGAPPYLTHGAPLTAYAVRPKRDCDGPDVSPAPPATIAYCLSKDGAHAFLTLTALPAENRFGASALLSVRGAPVVVPVRLEAASPETRP